MSSFNNLFHNLNFSKKSQLGPIFRTGGSITLCCYYLEFFCCLCGDDFLTPADTKLLQDKKGHTFCCKTSSLETKGHVAT